MEIKNGRQRNSIGHIINAVKAGVTIYDAMLRYPVPFHVLLCYIRGVSLSQLKEEQNKNSSELSRSKISRFHYSEQTKRQLISYIRDQNLSSQTASKMFNIPRNTLKIWEHWRYPRVSGNRAVPCHFKPAALNF